MVINSAKVALSGRKEEGKVYAKYTRYQGGYTQTSAAKMRQKNPDFILWHAVKGMLPRNPLGRAMFKKLKVYAGAEHPHTAQQPQALNI